MSAQASRSKSDQFEEFPSLFASVGTTGVVDLGASQTVIGSEQVSELLNNLPSEIQKQARKTKCNLIFKFGNHQTLPSKVALLLPLRGTWIRIAIVEGKTPFLLSSSFLKHVQAVIDTEKGTLWSKRLNRNLHMTQTNKNLFLLDINQLWESQTSKQCSEPDSILIAKSSPQESSDVLTNSDRCEKTIRAVPAEVKVPEPFDSQESCKSTRPSAVSENFSTHSMKHELKLETQSPQSCAPSSSESAAPGVPHCEPDHVRAVRSATSTPEATEGRRGSRRDRRDDLDRSRNTGDHVRQNQDGMQVPRSICRHPVDKIRGEQVRELDQERTSDVRPICATPSRQDGERGAQPGGSILLAPDTSGSYITQDREERSHDCSKIQGQTKGPCRKCADICSRSSSTGLSNEPVVPRGALRSARAHELGGTHPPGDSPPSEDAGKCIGRAAQQLDGSQGRAPGDLEEPEYQKLVTECFSLNHFGEPQLDFELWDETKTRAAYQTLVRKYRKEFQQAQRVIRQHAANIFV